MFKQKYPYYCFIKVCIGEEGGRKDGEKGKERRGGGLNEEGSLHKTEAHQIHSQLKFSKTNLHLKRLLLNWDILYETISRLL